MRSPEPGQARDQVRVGTRLAGRYEVQRLLGEGGMGAVYRGFDHRMRRDVAIKTISSERLRHDPNAMIRFEREAAAAAQVHHPCIVEVFDSGVEDGVPFLVMQYVRGEDLSAVIEKGRMEVARAVDLMLGLCAAVSAIHERGVVHRDIKPKNMKVSMERRGETLMLLDFGIAKLTGSRPFAGIDVRITAVDVLVGSLNYMSPEQASGSREVGLATDQYSIALVLYECLTQSRAFDGRNPLALMRRIVEGTFDRPRVIVPGLPAALDGAIARAMSRYPEDRFPAVEAFGEALLPFASIRGRRLWSDELTSRSVATQASGLIISERRDGAAPGGIAGTTVPLPPSLGLPRTAVLSPERGMGSPTTSTAPLGGTADEAVALAARPPAPSRGRLPTAAFLAIACAIGVGIVMAVVLLTGNGRPTATTTVAPSAVTGSGPSEVIPSTAVDAPAPAGGTAVGPGAEVAPPARDVTPPSTSATSEAGMATKSVGSPDEELDAQAPVRKPSPRPRRRPAKEQLPLTTPDGVRLVY